MKEDLAKREFELISRIVDRAMELGIKCGSRLNYFMDITYANDVFDIDLEAWLNADYSDFAHDIIGICSEINRKSIFKKGIADKSDFDWFVPRFARKDKLEDISKECLECAEMLVTLETEGTATYKSMKALRRAASKMNEVNLRYHKGVKVLSQGNDADDEILCPICYSSIARNDDYDEMKPKHCPECGTKLIY